jgi:membrane associated rhomboid family serine protease
VIPVGDYPNPPKPQLVTRILIGLNVAVFLFISLPTSGRPLTDAQLSDPATLQTLDKIREWQRVKIPPEQTAEWARRHIDQNTLLNFRFGYRPADPSLLGLLCCMFLHGGLSHLFFNMLTLWIYGDNVEYRLGAIGYLIWYLGTGIVGTLSFSFLDATSMTPLVGASGAISGILGFYLLWFPHNFVKVFFFFPLFGIIPIRAYWVIGIFVLWDNVRPMLAGGGGNVAHGAHLGGFAAGLLVAFLYNRIRGALPAPRPDRFAGYRPGHGGPVDPGWKQGPAPVTPVAPVDTTGEFESEVHAGQMEAAAHAFARLNREGGKPPAADAVFRLGQWLYAESFVQDAATVFRFYIKRYPRGNDLDRVHLGLGVLLARRLQSPKGAREHLLQAIELTDTPAIAETARAELALLGG